jgi:hypothetical protein
VTSVTSVGDQPVDAWREDHAASRRRRDEAISEVCDAERGARERARAGLTRIVGIERYRIDAIGACYVVVM